MIDKMKGLKRMKRLRRIDIKKVILSAALLLLMHFCISMEAYAADGNLSIAVSDTNISVGNTVKVTLRASGPNGENAASDMEFTYNSGVFSFVSCDTSDYSGGEGGKVTVSGSVVTITLKAIDQGSANLKVTGSNGKITDSQEALDSMVAAGVTIKAGSENNDSNKSGDNSLASLTLSAGELSPAFSYSVTKYTATVPYETTDLEVNAQPSNSKAQVESITGASGLQVGENTVSITVKAENGAKAVYTVKVTREEESARQPGDTAQPGTEGTAPEEGETGAGDGQSQIVAEETKESVDSSKIEEYENQIELLEKDYSKLNEKYKSEKSFARKIIAILIFVIAVLIIVLINVLIFMKRGKEEADEFGFDQEDRNRIKDNDRKPIQDMDDEDEDEWLDEEDEDEDEVQRSSLNRGKKKEDPEVEIIDLDDIDQKF